MSSPTKKRSEALLLEAHHIPADVRRFRIDGLDTNEKIRNFRKNLSVVIAPKGNETDIDIFFKRQKQPNRREDSANHSIGPTSSANTKVTFEEQVKAAMRSGKPLSVAYRIKSLDSAAATQPNEPSSITVSPLPGVPNHPLAHDLQNIATRKSGGGPFPKSRSTPAEGPAEQVSGDSELRLDSLKQAMATISSAYEELIGGEGSIGAMAENSGDPLTTDSKPVSSKSITPELMHHPNILCDGSCDGPVVGVRWKCVSCKDFDFCDACYAKERKQHVGKYGSHHMFMAVHEPVLSGYHFRLPSHCQQFVNRQNAPSSSLPEPEAREAETAANHHHVSHIFAPSHGAGRRSPYASLRPSWRDRAHSAACGSQLGHHCKPLGKCAPPMEQHSSTLKQPSSEAMKLRTSKGYHRGTSSYRLEYDLPGSYVSNELPRAESKRDQDPTVHRCMSYDPDKKGAWPVGRGVNAMSSPRIDPELEGAEDSCNKGELDLAHEKPRGPSGKAQDIPAPWQAESSSAKAPERIGEDLKVALQAKPCRELSSAISSDAKSEAVSKKYTLRQPGDVGVLQVKQDTEPYQNPLYDCEYVRRDVIGLGKPGLGVRNTGSRTWNLKEGNLVPQIIFEGARWSEIPSSLRPSFRIKPTSGLLSTTIGPNETATVVCDTEILDVIYVRLAARERRSAPHKRFGEQLCFYPPSASDSLDHPQQTASTTAGVNEANEHASTPSLSKTLSGQIRSATTVQEKSAAKASSVSSSSLLTLPAAPEEHAVNGLALGSPGPRRSAKDDMLQDYTAAPADDVASVVATTEVESNASADDAVSFLHSPACTAPSTEDDAYDWLREDRRDETSDLGTDDDWEACSYPEEDHLF